MGKRRRNPYTTAVVAGAVLLTGAAAAYAWTRNPAPKRRKRKREANPTKPKVTRCDPSPYVFHPDIVMEQIDTHIAQGQFDKAFIAQDIAFQLFGEHPDAGFVSFPPRPRAPKGVDCVWGLVTVMVDRHVPDLDLDQDEDLMWSLHVAGDPGYPWEHPSLHPENEPTPGLFVDAGHGNIDGIDDLVVRALGSALAMTGLDPGMAASTNSTAKRLRREYRALLGECEYLDRLYGQEDPDKAGGSAVQGIVYMMNQHGRGLHWDLVHADNLDRIGRGLPPLRTTDRQGEPLLYGDSGMLVWIPAIDLNALASKIPTVQPMQWSDGSSTREPPPCVQVLGVEGGLP